MGLLRKIRNPELFQGSLNRRGYFEGWYFKLISADRKDAVAVIPGIATGVGAAGDESHAFVQFIGNGYTEYFKYPLSAFQTDSRAFHVEVGGNSFSRAGILLNLGKGKIRGELKFTNVLPFPKTLLSPGIMGPYSYVPGMECYHGIVNIRHSITGSLKIDGHKVSFDSGTGYVEKDWGRAFPSAWVWVQANHFERDAAFLLSVADIPWLGGSFRGFFAFLHLEGRLYRFATYTGAKLIRLAEVDGMTEAALSQKGWLMEISAKQGPGGMLKAPKNGLMDRIIEESISATVAVKLTDTQGKVIFDGSSPCAGMERYEAGQLMGQP